MFFVIDKSKIISYVLAICTVVILFVAAAGLNKVDSNNVVATSTNAINQNNVLNENILANNVLNEVTNQNILTNNTKN